MQKSVYGNECKFSFVFVYDILIESGIVSEGSIKGVLTGKHYNRSVFCHKIMHEAFQRLRFETFLDSLDVTEQEKIRTFVEAMGDAFPTQQYNTKTSF
jgi:hypothetical protein